MTSSPNDMEKEAIEPKGKRKALKIILIVFLSILTALLAVFVFVSALSHFGKKSLLGEQISVAAPSDLTEEAEEDGSSVVYKGKKYIYNENVTSFLFLGIDDDAEDEEEQIGKKGQADTVFLATLDTKTGNIKIIPISRESMVDINVYTTNGNYAGVKNTQLCLAYAYGTDRKSCAENVKRSVSRLLYGVDINSYFTVNLEGVEKFVNLIGGVEVTILEDINRSEATLKKGEKRLLKGKTAIAYIRSREDDINSNNLRMQRQKQFLTAMLNKAGNKVLSDFTKLSSYYNTMKPYIATDLTFAEISYLATTFLSTDIGSSVEYISISGTSSMHNGSACFIPDRESLYDAVIKAFYVEEQ